MIDHESTIYADISNVLRKTFKGIRIIGTEFDDTPPSFPAVSIIQSDNTINDRYSTLASLENATREAYKFEIVSNLKQGKEQQCKTIAEEIDEIMVEKYAYLRTFNQPVPAADTSLARRVLRYVNNVSTQ